MQLAPFLPTRKILASALLAAVCMHPAWALAAFVSFEDVKREFRSSDTAVLDRNGELLQRVRTDATVRRGQWTALADVSPALRTAMVLSEDRRFYEHSGIDWRAVSAAAWGNLWNTRTRGASTITMQTVKNLFLWSRPLGSVRKVVELPLAVYFDALMSKRRIMEIYLNIAEWGPGIYGIEAAARYHFGVSAKNLSRRQAALLAVALPNPITRDPGKPGPGLRRLAALIERRAARAGAYVGCLD